MWNAALPRNSIIEYGILKENTRLIKVDEEDVYHEVRLDDLDQETEYLYRIYMRSHLLVNGYSFKQQVIQQEFSAFLHTEIHS